MLSENHTSATYFTYRYWIGVMTEKAADTDIVSLCVTNDVYKYTELFIRMLLLLVKRSVSHCFSTIGTIDKPCKALFISKSC